MSIAKLQPHRSMYLRGFDRRGAAASLHNASAAGFTLSGCWSDQADFAVAVLFDADDVYGHLFTSRYLPDFSLAGVTLDFDLAWTGCQNPTSSKYPSVRVGLAQLHRAQRGWRGCDRNARHGGAAGYGDDGRRAGQLHLHGQRHSGGVRPRATGLPGQRAVRSGGAGMDRVRVHRVLVLELPGHRVQPHDHHRHPDLHPCSTCDRWFGRYRHRASESHQRRAGRERHGGGIGEQRDAHAETEHRQPRSPAPHPMATPPGRFSKSRARPRGWLANWWRRSTRTPSCRRRRPAAPLRSNRGRSAWTATESNCWRCTRPTTCYLTPAGASKLTGGTDPTSIHVHMDFSALGLASVRQLWLTFAPPLTYDAGTVNPSLVAFAPQEWSAVFSNLDGRRSGRRDSAEDRRARIGDDHVRAIRGPRGRVAAGLRWRAGTWAASPGRAPMPATRLR